MNDAFNLLFVRKQNYILAHALRVTAKQNLKRRPTREFFANSTCASHPPWDPRRLIRNSISVCWWLHACRNARDSRACNPLASWKIGRIRINAHTLVSFDSNFACCQTRALRRSPFCDRTKNNDRMDEIERERERERIEPWPEGLLEFPAGICLIGNRHGRRNSPLRPTAPSARSHRCENASRATCASVFRPVTLIPSLHTRRLVVLQHSINDERCLRTIDVILRPLAVNRVHSVSRFFK